MRNLVVVVVSAYAWLPFAALAQNGGHDHTQHAGPAGQQAAGSLKQDHADHGPAKPLDRASNLRAGKQTVCPVSGDPIDPKVSTAYQGRNVNFCCEDCIAKFEKSPERYLATLYKQLYPQRVQVTCPVMGGEIDPEVSIEHEGKKVYFCCGGCDSKFKKDPAKYERKLNDASTDQVHCPVDGKPINPTFSLDGKDRMIYFCSEQCHEKFKSDAAYATAALPAVGVLAKGPTTAEDIVSCAVTGQVGKRGQMRSVVYQDKVYFAHSSACVERFKASPAVHAERAAQEAKSGRPLQSNLQPSPARGNLLLDPNQSGHAGHSITGVNSGLGASGRTGTAGHGGHGGGPAGGHGGCCGH